ncbi:MAG: hypothetical protein ACP5I1_05885 [Candidatus Hinthialibacter sp.]
MAEKTLQIAIVCHRKKEIAMRDIANIAQRAAAILDSVNEGIFTVEHEWRITAFNTATERIISISRELDLRFPV